MQIYGPANIFNIDIKAMDARFPFWVNEPKIFVAFKNPKMHEFLEACYGMKLND